VQAEKLPKHIEALKWWQKQLRILCLLGAGYLNQQSGGFIGLTESLFCVPHPKDNIIFLETKIILGFAILVLKQTFSI